MFKKTFAAGCMIAAASAETSLAGRQFVLEPLDGQAPVLIEFDEHNNPEMLGGLFGLGLDLMAGAAEKTLQLAGGAFEVLEEGTKGVIDIGEDLLRKTHQTIFNTDKDGYLENMGEMGDVAAENMLRTLGFGAETGLKATSWVCGIFSGGCQEALNDLAKKAKDAGNDLADEVDQKEFLENWGEGLRKGLKG